jgi:3',5'-cyclic AMP phosphodiesterase CpdA
LPPEVFVGAGDIGLCSGGGNPAATARLLDAIAGTVFTAGDNVYPSGTAQEFRECYDPTWGRHKGRTRPVPGNHEYETGGAAPYFEYFGTNAGPPGLGYYSFELGNWHAIALNSNIPVGAGSAQGAWLRADLASSRARCTIAYWHHPLFSSGQNGNQSQMRDFWRLLYDADADIVLSGHDHLYERFTPQQQDGFPDPTRGIRQFTVGTGGALLSPIVTVRPNSEVRISALGVLRLTLNADSYQWSFIPVSGPGDSGTGTCH